MRGSKERDDDLEWYYCERAGDLGLRGVQIEPSVRGEAKCGPTERQIVDAARARVIEAALHSLSLTDQRVLKQAHERLTPARQIELSGLGPLAVVIEDQMGREALAAARKTARSRKANNAAARAAAIEALSESRIRAFRSVAGALARFRSERAERRLASALARHRRIEARAIEWMGRIWDAANLRVFGSAGSR